MTEVANKGFHPFLETDHPHIFIDSCMQAWPDADYANAHRHGVTAYAATAWDPHANAERALDEGMFWHLIARKYPNTLVVERADDIRRAKREGKAAFIIAAQGGDFIGNRLGRIEAFYRLGLRMMLPTYNRTNGICDGCLDRTDSGLTRFGELVVAESNRVGLLLDCTHIGRRASLEIIERSSVPVVFSHSNAKALVDNPRNIDDEQIRACAERGGVIGLAPWGPLVLKAGRVVQPPLDDFIDHIDYVAQVTGSAEHIGIGTDMSLGTYPDHEHDPWGEPAWPPVADTYGKLISADVRSPLRALDGFSNYTHVTNLIDRLGARGYSDADIGKILGGNYLRVFAQVWK
ncbi:MAG TPA: membrane dipeptidase [Thermomicrobiales bacterium]